MNMIMKKSTYEVRENVHVDVCKHFVYMLFRVFGYFFAPLPVTAPQRSVLCVAPGGSWQPHSVGSDRVCCGLGNSWIRTLNCCIAVRCANIEIPEHGHEL